MKNHIISNSLRALAFLSFLSLVFNVWGLYFLTQLFSNSTSTFNSLFKDIWLPALPILITWILVIILGWIRWKPVMFFLVIASYWIIKNSVNNIIHLSGFSGIEYWISVLASWSGLIAAMLNIVVLLIWLKKGVKS